MFVHIVGQRSGLFLVFWTHSVAWTAHSSLAQGKESLHIVAEHKTPMIDTSHGSSAAAWGHTADAAADATADAAAARCTPNCGERETVTAIVPERVRSYRDVFPRRRTVAKLVVEDQDDHIGDELGAGGNAERSRENRDSEHGRNRGRGAIRGREPRKVQELWQGEMKSVLARYTRSLKL